MRSTQNLRRSRLIWALDPPTARDLHLAHATGRTMITITPLLMIFMAIELSVRSFRPSIQKHFIEGIKQEPNQKHGNAGEELTAMRTSQFRRRIQAQLPAMAPGLPRPQTLPGSWGLVRQSSGGLAMKGQAGFSQAATLREQGTPLTSNNYNENARAVPPVE